MTYLYIILAILVLEFLIFIHELGHFAAGKLLGFRVLGFSLGFGPAIFKKKMGETEYAFRAIPFGGACQFDGDDDPGARVRLLNVGGHFGAFQRFHRDRISR